MKKLLIAIFCILAASFSLASYAEGGDCEGRKGKKPDFSVLNIADDKQEQFESLLKNHREAHKQLRKANKGKTDEARSQMKALREGHKAEMKAFLTAEQFTKFEEMMEKRREHRKGMRKGRQGDKEES